MKIFRTGLILIFLLLFACTGSNIGGTNSTDTFSPFIIIDTTKDSSETQDIQVEDVPPPDPCLSITVSHPGWCSCNPHCCQAQQWFCPPAGLNDPTYYKKDVIVDVCNDNVEACLYGHDEGCPPPELIYEGPCNEAYECPPMSSGLDLGWQLCQLADGMLGKQQVTCDKGKLQYTPCQGCEAEICDGIDNDCDGLVDEDIGVAECYTQCGPGSLVCVQGEELCFGPQPQEEICDYLDNDCDDKIDEDQRNACDECGSVPGEECDNIDNDCDDVTDEELVNACSTVCESGVTVCLAGNWSGCTAQQPTQEVCDGLDNDCDSQIDEGLECLCTIQDVGTLFPCAEPPLLCGQGFKTCECVDPGCLTITTTECYAICYWLVTPNGSDPTCDPLVGMPLNEEECNNFDDNCNQLIDEDLYLLCYTGPEGTLGVGTCEPGQYTCNAGAWGGYDDQNMFISGMCMDEVLPQDEICDGLDNDCDGTVDWGAEVPETDILFIVDWSGSMSDEISAVLSSLNQFANHFALQDKLHWGLVVGPRQPSGDSSERLYLISDISPFQDFLTDFAGLGNLGMNTAHEMLLDALYFSLQNISGDTPIDLTSATWIGWTIGESVPPKDDFNINWRSGADRVIIVFSDEQPQTYLDPPTTVQQIISTGQATPQLKIYTFSTTEVWEWDEIAVGVNGKYFKLSNNTLEMYNYLMEILDEICMPPASP